MRVCSNVASTMRPKQQTSCDLMQGVQGIMYCEVCTVMHNAKHLWTKPYTYKGKKICKGTPFAIKIVYPVDKVGMCTRREHRLERTSYLQLFFLGQVLCTSIPHFILFIPFPHDPISPYFPIKPPSPLAIYPYFSSLAHQSFKEVFFAHQEIRHQDGNTSKIHHLPFTGKILSVLNLHKHLRNIKKFL